MTDIYSFYSGESANEQGLYINDILNKDKKWLENNHTYIQLLFPLKEQSAYNKQAPLLTDSIIEQLKSSDKAKENILKAFHLMINFYGINLDDSKLYWRQWITPYNHNYKRITRIIKSLKLLGFNSEAGRLFSKLELIYNKYSFLVGKQTYKYWEDAYNS